MPGASAGTGTPELGHGHCALDEAHGTPAASTRPVGGAGLPLSWDPTIREAPSCRASSMLNVRRAWVVRVVGLEPTLRTEANFKSAASARSATPAACDGGGKLTYG